MSLTYNDVLRQLALTTNSFGGATTPSTLNSTYNTTPLTIANFNVATGSSIFSFTFLKEKLLNAQEGLFMALASTSTNPLRVAIESQTASLAYGAQILTNAAGLPVVGAYGTVRDASNSQPLTLNEIEDIRIRVQSSWMVLNVYQYAIVGDRIYPTRPGVIVDVCGYERPDADALDLTTEILLPDILGSAMVQGAIAECYRDDEYLQQSGRAAEFYQAWITALRSGMAQIQPQSNPTPDAQTAYAKA
jgi:hypothetical protein